MRTWVLRADGHMQDLEMAKERLFDEDLGILIVKDGHVIYESGSRGLSGLLEAIDTEGKMLEGAAVADRVVGKAAALLCVFVKVEAVYAITLSREAKAVLERHAIRNEWTCLVDGILDVDRVGLCPFEKLVAGISSPKVAYEMLRILCENFRHQDQR